MHTWSLFAISMFQITKVLVKTMPSMGPEVGGSRVATCALPSGGPQRVEESKLLHYQFLLGIPTNWLKNPCDLIDTNTGEHENGHPKANNTESPCRVCGVMNAWCEKKSY